MAISGEDGYQPGLVEGKADRFVVLSGCSGGGKSALLSELGRRGFLVFEEAGRQVIKEQLYIGGEALPSGNSIQFTELTVSRAIHNLITAARGDRVAFFDRGIVDQVSGLEHQGLPVPQHLANAAVRFRYRGTVFMVPPWPEIFASDSERRHSFDNAVASYAALLRTYERLGYCAVTVPKLPVAARADFVTANLGIPA